jgi:uncharacterized protein YtpQ (UPF0354 family)
MPADWFSKFFKRQSDPQDAHRGNARWKIVLAKDSLTKEEFCQSCKDAVYELFPDAQIEPGDSFDEFRVLRSGREPNTVFLENIWRQCRQQPESRVSQVERFLRSLTSTMSDSDTLPERTCIVPMIKDEGYFNVFPNRDKEEVPFANEHFVGDLWIVYAIDSPDSMKTLHKSQVSELGLEPSDLKKLAIDNLRRILPPIEQHGEGPAYMLTAGADYVASLLLFEDLWAELKQQVTGDILAAVPTRDVLLFTDSDSSEGVRQMKTSIDNVMEAGGYHISSTILRLTDDGWKVASVA